MTQRDCTRGKNPQAVDWAANPCAAPSECRRQFEDNIIHNSTQSLLGDIGSTLISTAASQVRRLFV